VVGKNRWAILHWSCINANIIHIFLCLQCDIKICTVIANQILAVFTTLPTGLKLVVSKGRFAGQELNWRGQVCGSGFQGLSADSLLAQPVGGLHGLWLSFQRSEIV
jgi:hypothetical protein